MPTVTAHAKRMNLEPCRGQVRASGAANTRPRSSIHARLPALQGASNAKTVVLCQTTGRMPQLHDDDRVGVDGLIRRGRPTEHAPGCRSSLPSSFLIRPIALRCSWVRAHDGRKAGARARRQSGKQGRP
jgi:hypothetical protein